MLTYTAIMSLDGYVADAGGSFDWAMPDQAVHVFINDLMRPVGTHLYGRRMYQVMTAWETDPALAEHSAATRDFAALWQCADKIVWSGTLRQPSTSRTTIERTFDPGRIRLVKQATDSELAISGPTLAAAALRAGLVDEVRTFIAPVTLGRGLRAFPDDIRVDLTLLEQRTFHQRGMLYARHAVTPTGQ